MEVNVDLLAPVAIPSQKEPTAWGILWGSEQLCTSGNLDLALDGIRKPDRQGHDTGHFASYASVLRIVY